MHYTIKSIKTIKIAARQFIQQIGANTVFAFNGTMGAGKTTFIKSICQELGVTDTVNSPTFSIVNEYKTNDGKIIYHFDCYRINNLDQALEIGIEEYLYSGNLCFIEWAENIAALLPDSVVNFDIKELENGERIVSLCQNK